MSPTSRVAAAFDAIGQDQRLALLQQQLEQAQRERDQLLMRLKESDERAAVAFKHAGASPSPREPQAMSAGSPAISRVDDFTRLARGKLFSVLSASFHSRLMFFFFKYLFQNTRRLSALSITSKHQRRKMTNKKYNRMAWKNDGSMKRKKMNNSSSKVQQ